MTSKKLALRKNFLSGLEVSFIALPLCIAISLASGFPVLSGIFTAIIGGILVSQLSGSHVTINGPAAGMIVVILEAVDSLGQGDSVTGYKLTLAAIVCAAILQAATSFTKLPNLMRKFPESIIRGMMMAIGLIVIVKQSFILFGYTPPKIGLIALIGKLPQAFMGMETDTFVIGVVSVMLIVLWQKLMAKNKIPQALRALPIYLIAIVFGAILAQFFEIASVHHYLSQSMSAPVHSYFIALPDKITDAFAAPDFSKVLSLHFAMAVLSIYAVGSLETVLSAIAVDKIDPQKRHTDLKKDLRAVGIGNLISGCIGGLPMIAEIVRSSANVKYGATNKWSNFSHGICLLLMITIFSSVLKFIPLCVLAAMLIMIGWTLINVKLFSQILRKDPLDALTISGVIFFTIFVDLLAGIFVGVLIHLLLHRILPRFCKKS